MEICKYRREEKDYYSIVYHSDSKYPKIIPATKGSSICYFISPEWIFKRKQQDGNYGIDNASNSLHHFIYQEEVGSFDDLAEVFCYKLSKRLGTTKKIDIYGNTYNSPTVDVAEYKLASFANKKGEEERGCLSRNVVPSRSSLITGATFLKNYFGTSNNKNSIENYLTVLQNYSRKTGTILDPNIVRDLIVNSFFCWKTANSDNHSSNITFIQTLNREGRPYLYVSKMIDNGSAWGCSSPYSIKMVNGSTIFKYQNILSRYAEEGSSSLQSEPFEAHVAFKIQTNFLGKNSNEAEQSEYSSYLYGLSAYAFSSPAIYSSIYQIEKNFDIDGVAEEMEREMVKFPPYFLQMVKATTEYKSQVLSKTMGDFFCRIAYSQCISSNIAEDAEVFKTFQNAFLNLPLQESVEGYVQNFAKVAEENNIEINKEGLQNINFMPNNFQNEQTTTQQESEVLEQ